MAQSHHRIKTFGKWQVRQPFPGVYLWRDPHGATYLVDHTGTRRVDRLSSHLPLTVEIYRTDTQLRWAAVA